eukprot:scaffold95778_cov51-Phaeocystis_antarctica.AAC.1
MLASHTITHTRRRTWEGEALHPVDAVLPKRGGHEVLVEPLLVLFRHTSSARCGALIDSPGPPEPAGRCILHAANELFDDNIGGSILRRIEEHKGLVVAPALVIEVGDARPLGAVKLALRLLAATPPNPHGRTRLHANAPT